MNVFKLLSGITLGIILLLMGLYDYYDIIGASSMIKLSIKILPLTVLIFLNISYFFLYRVTKYSLVNSLSLMFCLFGDLFLGLYDPSLLETSENKIFYLILGGCSFLIARILWTFILMIYPTKSIKLIPYSYSDLFLSHIIWTGLFSIFGLLLLLYQESLISFLVSAYICLTFGIPLSYTVLRISADTFESKFIRYISFLGILLFNISDILLLVTLQTSLFPSYVILISDNIYWIAMYLMTVSIFRFPDENIEKGILYL